MNSKEVHLSKTDKEEMLASLSENPPFGKLLKSNGDGSVKISVSVTSEEMSPTTESHDNFNDIFLVQSGEEEIWIGGKIVDRKETEPGEWIGEKLEGAEKKKIKAGDVLIVPKGVPHQHGAGKTVLFVIKTS